MSAAQQLTVELVEYGVVYEADRQLSRRRCVLATCCDGEGVRRCDGSRGPSVVVMKPSENRKGDDLPFARRH